MNANAVGTFFSSCRDAITQHHMRFRSAATAFFANARTQLGLHRAKQLDRDRTEASAFTVFEWIKPDENCLSDIFANLLDPALGDHGQGTLFLGELFRVAGIPMVEGLDKAEAWLEEDTWLIDNPLRRIDIVVRLPSFGIAIENKPWASDQVDQVADYVEYMRRCYGERFAFFYWSGQGAAPTSIMPQERERLERAGRLHIWSYQREVREWLEACRHACQAKKVDWFLTDLLGYLARSFVEMPRPSEAE
jgi:hypothetical protein